MFCLQYPRPKLTFKEVDASAGTICYISELGCEIVFHAVNRRGFYDFRVSGGVCPEGDVGHDEETLDFIHRTIAPGESLQLVREFTDWLELRKRVPF